LAGHESLRFAACFTYALTAGTKIGFAMQSAAGRGFVWGEEWIEFDSEWSTRPDIKALWVNVFKWLQERGCLLAPPR
jgi:hypothetical protein